MSTQHYPNLYPEVIAATRAALHAYSRILGFWLKACRPKRKHWWHASLRPSLNGLTTGVVRADIDFEIELNLREGLLQGRTSSGGILTVELHGQATSTLESTVRKFLINAGIHDRFVPKAIEYDAEEFIGYSADQARFMASAINSVSSVMGAFRAGIREETSPIQLWPHHFDLSMLWLPGETIPGQDAENEEYADKQMNFGFAFGDEAIPEPYFYVTAYPLPAALPKVSLPEGTEWKSAGFNGAVITWKSLLNTLEPQKYLLDLWNGLLSAGREHLLENSAGGFAQ